jgi:hypothetical protein
MMGGDTEVVDGVGTIHIDKTGKVDFFSKAEDDGMDSNAIARTTIDTLKKLGSTTPEKGDASRYYGVAGLVTLLGMERYISDKPEMRDKVPPAEVSDAFYRILNDPVFIEQWNNQDESFKARLENTLIKYNSKELAYLRQQLGSELAAEGASAATYTSTNMGSGLPPFPIPGISRANAFDLQVVDGMGTVRFVVRPDIDTSAMSIEERRTLDASLASLNKKYGDKLTKITKGQANVSALVRSSTPDYKLELDVLKERVFPVSGF